PLHGRPRMRSPTSFASRAPSRSAIALALLLACRAAPAAPRCMTVNDFNAFMDQQVSAAVDVTLGFTVTGVNLDDYFNGKGWLAELADTKCAGMGTASLKVYGTSNPINGAHPPGTLKLEYGSNCCASQGCPIEYWADPNPGPPIFKQPSQ